MASLDTGGGDSGHKKGPGVKKAKKLSTRVDMTPMVDLGFLLITFFIFTTTMSTPTTMNLNMPADIEKDQDKTKIKESGALTIIMGKDNRIYWYSGKLDEGGQNFKTANYQTIREEIINKKKEVMRAFPSLPAADKVDADGKPKAADSDFFVVIKPTDDATYKNMVDILDEMKINVVERYSLADVNDAEKAFIGATEGSAPAPAAAPSGN